MSAPTLCKQLLRYRPMIRALARRVAWRYADPSVQDDLESIGTLGLWEAFSRAEALRPESLDAYARLRVQGAMVDALRKQDWVPRAIRRNARALDTEVRALTQALSRPPTLEELAKHLEMTIPALQALLRNSHSSEVQSLDAARGGTAQRVGDYVASDLPSPEDMSQAARVARVVRAAVAQLPCRDRAVVEGYFFEGQSLKDLAGRFGVTESRVSQIITRSKGRLREELLEQVPFLLAA